MAKPTATTIFQVQSTSAPDDAPYILEDFQDMYNQLVQIGQEYENIDIVLTEEETANLHRYTAQTLRVLLFSDQIFEGQNSLNTEELLDIGHEIDGFIRQIDDIKKRIKNAPSPSRQP